MTGRNQAVEMADTRRFMLARKQRRGKLVSARREVIEQGRIRRGLERNLARQLVSTLDKIAARAGEQYEYNGFRAINRNAILQDLTAVIVPSVRATMTQMVERFSFVDPKQSPYERFIEQYIATEVGEHIQNIERTTLNQIRRAIQEGNAEDLGARAIAGRIRERVGGSMGRRRAITIARTETHSAASYANHAVAQESGVQFKKRWVSTNDARTRQHHREMNGTEVGMDEDFIVPYKGTNYKMGYAGDPRGGPANVINCRCVIVYFEEEDVVFDDDTGQVTPETAKPQPQTKPRIGITELFVGRISKKNKENLEEQFNAGLTPETAVLVDKLDKPRQIKRGKGWYQPAFKDISTPVTDEVVSGTRHTAKSVLLHEYGHHIDYSLGSPVKARSNTDTFRTAINDDFEHLKELGLDEKGVMDELLEVKSVTETVKRGRFKGASRTYETKVAKFETAELLSDVGDAIFRGRIYELGGWGHGVNYYKRKGNRETEIFANIFAIQNNPLAMATARRLFPNVTKLVELIIKEGISV